MIDTAALIKKLAEHPNEWTYVGRSHDSESMQDQDGNIIAFGSGLLIFATRDGAEKRFQVPRVLDPDRDAQMLHYFGVIEQWFETRRLAALRPNTAPSVREVTLAVGDQTVTVSATRVARLAERMYRHMTPLQRSTHVERSMTRLRKATKLDLVRREAAVLLGAGITRL
jgi:hypothetical protein